MLLAGIVLLAGTGAAFADMAAVAREAYRHGDYATALALYRSLAEQGDAAAQYILGGMYDKGEGVPRDTIEANKWWYRAALHGNADALRKFDNIICQKRFPNGRGAIPGVNCLDVSGNNLDVSGNSDGHSAKTNPAAAAKLPAPASEQQAAASAAAAGQLAAILSQATATAGHTPSLRFAVPLQRQSGIFTLPIEINAQITLNFVIDSGAAFVTVPADVFAKLQQTGTVQDLDLHGQVRFGLADGSMRWGTAFTIRSLRLGDKLFENVRGAVVPTGGKLLLGQTFLQRFTSWSMDNDKGELVFELPSAANWWSMYRSRIANMLVTGGYPADAAARREEGTVVITFTVDRSGHVTERHIVRSAGSASLDKAVLDLVDGSQPFPPLPADYSQPHLTMTFPVRFALPADDPPQSNQP